jgi:hypothetical protein
MLSGELEIELKDAAKRAVYKQVRCTFHFGLIFDLEFWIKFYACILF